MEGLRGLAVLLVFMQHYGVQALLAIDLAGAALPAAQWMRNLGNLGVELFFILSGFLIYGTLLRRRPGFAGFMRRRAQRIYPAFLCVFALAVAAHLALASGEIPADPAAAIGLLLANLLLLPGIMEVRPLLDVAWTLSWEMGFYLLLGLGVPALGMPAWPRARRVAGILAAMACVTLACALAPGGAGPLSVPLPLIPLLAGMLLFEVSEVGFPPIPAAAALIAGVAVLVATQWLVPWPLLREWFETLALWLVVLTGLRGGNVVAGALSGTALRWLGNMSYSFYLLHGAVLVAVFRTLVGLVGGGWPSWTFWALLVPVFARGWLASPALFVAVERPVSLLPRGRAARALTPSAGS